MANNLRVHENKAKPKKARRGPNKFKPKYMSGSYAILVALLKNAKNNPNKTSMTRDELIQIAQPLTGEPFIRGKPNTYYKFWLAMRRLLSRKLVIAEPKKIQEFHLSEGGLKFAEELQEEYDYQNEYEAILKFLRKADENILRERTDVIEVWLEEAENVIGPITLRIRQGATMADLRKVAERKFGVPVGLQKWIVHRQFCKNDNESIAELAKPYFTAPFFLCHAKKAKQKMVTPKMVLIQPKIEPQASTSAYENNGNMYDELMLLEGCSLVPNKEKFECGVCIAEYEAGEGVVLKECVHTFCRACLAEAVKQCRDAEVACPATDCFGKLQEREVRALVSAEEYERWLAQGLAVAESAIGNSFHCRTRDCTGWALCEPGVRLFPCPVCKHTTCIPCESVHEGMTCYQYRISAAIDNIGDVDTKKLINRLIACGEAITCPHCNTVIIKKLGCDWVLCACRTEICWVTRGRRWGPKGRGDTSAGCQCGLNGKRCHPACRNCH